MAGITLNGRTDTLGPRNLGESFQRFNIDQEGEFNVTLSTPLSSFAIRNSRNEPVAFGTNALAPQTGRVRLAPGTYTALISEQVPDARDRAFSLRFTPRQNAAVTAAGGTLQGTMDAPREGQQVQEHTLYFGTGGRFNIGFNLPNAAFSISNPAGEVIASGTNGPDTGTDRPGTETGVEAGTHALTVVGYFTPAAARWTLNVTPAGAPSSQDAKPSGIQQILDRRQKWLATQANLDLLRKAQSVRSQDLLA